MFFRRRTRDKTWVLYLVQPLYCKELTVTLDKMFAIQPSSMTASIRLLLVLEHIPRSVRRGLNMYASNYPTKILSRIVGPQKNPTACSTTLRSAQSEAGLRADILTEIKLRLHAEISAQ